MTKTLKNLNKNQTKTRQTNKLEVNTAETVADLMSPDGPKLIHMFRYWQCVSRAPGSKNGTGPRSAPFTLGRL